MNQTFSQPHSNSSNNADTETRQGVVLTIRSGLLEGSERFIDLPNFLVGSGKEADILLVDEGIAPVQFVVGVTRSMLGVSISIQAAADGVILSGQHLPPEEVFHAQNSIEFEVAGVSLAIHDAKGFQYTKPEAELTEGETDSEGDTPDDGPEKADNKSLSFLMASAAVACFSFSIFLYAFGLGGDTQQVSDAPEINKTDEVSRDKFIIQLKDKLKEAELETLIQVNKRGENSIEVAGRLRKNHEKKWMSVLQWYDSQASPPLLFNQVGKPSIEKNLPKIKFVWFGKEPYVVLHNNQKISVGDTLKSGWKIETVNASGIMMTQADRRILLKF